VSKPKWLTCPAELGDRAGRYWNQYAARLHAEQELTRNNLAKFAALCRLLAIIDAASAEIDANGVVVVAKSGAVKPNPAVAVILNAQRQAAPLLQRFCL
jgi:phage terminase small subunit